MANIDDGFEVEILSLNDNTLITSGNIDPSSVGYEAPIGSLYITDAAVTYHKTGAGDTDWTISISDVQVGGTATLSGIGLTNVITNKEFTVVGTPAGFGQSVKAETLSTAFFSGASLAHDQMANLSTVFSTHGVTDEYGKQTGTQAVSSRYDDVAPITDDFYYELNHLLNGEDAFILRKEPTGIMYAELRVDDVKIGSPTGESAGFGDWTFNKTVELSGEAGIKFTYLDVGQVPNVEFEIGSLGVNSDKEIQLTASNTFKIVAPEIIFESASNDEGSFIQIGPNGSLHYTSIGLEPNKWRDSAINVSSPVGDVNENIIYDVTINETVNEGTIIFELDVAFPWWRNATVRVKADGVIKYIDVFAGTGTYAFSAGLAVIEEYVAGTVFTVTLEVDVPDYSVLDTGYLEVSSYGLETSFITNVDTPITYAGEAGKYVTVNSTSDGLVFTDFNISGDFDLNGHTMYDSTNGGDGTNGGLNLDVNSGSSSTTMTLTNITHNFTTSLTPTGVELAADTSLTVKAATIVNIHQTPTIRLAADNNLLLTGTNAITVSSSLGGVQIKGAAGVGVSVSGLTFDAAPTTNRLLKTDPNFNVVTYVEHNPAIQTVKNGDLIIASEHTTIIGMVTPAPIINDNVYTLNGITGEISIVQSGTFEIDATVSIRSNTSADRFFALELYVNGTQVTRSGTFTSSNEAIGSASIHGYKLDLNASDVITFAGSGYSGNGSNYNGYTVPHLGSVFSIKGLY